MAKHVKCYTGNYDGINQGLIIANSQKRAAEIAGCSLYEFNRYWHIREWPNFNPVPFNLYTRKMLSDDEWKEK